MPESETFVHWHERRQQQGQDKEGKGRNVCNPKVGSESHLAKLNEEKVREIRAVYDLKKPTFSKLALEYGVSFGLISQIIRRVVWKHI